jgi:hypothetical protein
MPLSDDTLRKLLVTADPNTGSESPTLSISGLLAAASSFSVATDIAPLHWWRADTTAQSGGLVDAITDNGSAPKDFTQTGAARCPTATDANGKTYLAFDGLVDFYQAGTASDWKFLNDSTPWTICVVLHNPTNLNADSTLLDTCNYFATASQTGFFIMQQFVASSPAEWGAVSSIVNGTVGVVTVGDHDIDLNVRTLVFRNHGLGGIGFVGPMVGDFTFGSRTSSPDQFEMRRNGTRRAASKVATPGAEYSSNNPTNTLTLARRSGTSDKFGSARIYEILMTNKELSDRQVLGWENYARQAYNVAM